MKKRVCILTSVHRWNDMRIFKKQAQSLAYQYDVELHAPAEFKCKVVNGVKVFGLPKWRKRTDRFKIIWILFKRMRKSKAEVFHLHDPELIPVGIILRLCKRIVIFDMHELISEQIEYKDWLYNNLFKNITKRVYTFFEYLAIRFFNKIVLAVDERIKSFLKRYKREKNKFCIISNFPILSDIKKADPKIKGDDETYVVYSGGLTKPRGIKEMINAIEMLKGKAKLILLGRWENEMLFRECQELPGWKYVKYIGWVDPSDMYGYIKSSVAGICALHPVKNYIVNLPTKVFEYMACSIPVITSDFPLYREKFTGCAYFVNPMDPQEIAKKIALVIDNKEQARRMGEAGKKMVESKYNWTQEKEKLIRLYEELL